MAMNRLLIPFITTLAVVFSTAGSGAPHAALDSPPNGLRDSVSWDTSAWSRLQGADRVPITPLSTEPMVITFLTDVFNAVGPFRAVARNQVTWDSLWNQVTSHGRYAGACCKTAAAVDFSREMIVAAGNGMRHAGDDITVVRAATRQDTLYVYVLSKSNMLPKCLQDAMVNPVAVVRTVRWGGPVSFAEGTVRGVCTKSSGGNG